MNGCIHFLLLFNIVWFVSLRKLKLSNIYIGTTVFFVPFYLPTKEQLKVVIIGGGYAGIAAMTVLSRYASNIDLTIIDPKEKHLKVTHLHETFRYPLADLFVSFYDLEKRFDCRHICAALTLDEYTLQQWQIDQYLVVNKEAVPFDYLLVATGVQENDVKRLENVLSPQDFMIDSGSNLLKKLLAKSPADGQPITVVGGGATGIQFLFEIQQFLRRKNISNKVRLIHAGGCVLEKLPDGFASYVQSRMTDLEIDFYPNTYYREQQEDTVLLEEKKTGALFELPSILSVIFSGKKQGQSFTANPFGQVMIGQTPLKNIFVAGDCAHFNSFGSNTLTAQSAVRKGKLAARNILRHSGVFKLFEPYLHHDIGNVVSLGSADAVGWFVSEKNVVTGLPALAIKEIVESQYDLLLMGIDTYVV